MTHPTPRRDLHIASGSQRYRRDKFVADDRYSRLNEVMGEAAERWVAGFLGADTSIIDSLVRDPGWDMVHKGQKVDVKWSHWVVGEHRRFKGGGEQWGYPTLNVWMGFQADVYVLVSGASPADFDLYEWAHGWATRAEVLAAPTKAGLKGTPYHWIGFDYLHPLDMLL